MLTYIPFFCETVQQHVRIFFEADRLELDLTSLRVFSFDLADRSFSSHVFSGSSDVFRIRIGIDISDGRLNHVRVLGFFFRSHIDRTARFFDF